MMGPTPSFVRGILAFEVAAALTLIQLIDHERLIPAGLEDTILTPAVMVSKGRQPKAAASEDRQSERCEWSLRASYVQADSPVVASTDGDEIVFRSSDRVLFNVHLANLRAETDGPFASDPFGLSSEIKDLDQDSKILDVLFCFVYDQQHPSFEEMPIEDVLELAEAAEEYGVVSARNACRVRVL